MGLLDFFSQGKDTIQKMKDNDAIVDKMYEKRDVEGLINALKNKDQQVRAAGKLGYFGDPRAIDPLIELLISEDLMTSLWAASALGELKAKKAVDPLIKTFLNFEQLFTPSNVAASFSLQTGKNVDSSMFGEMASNKNDLAAQNRMYIVEALGNIGDEKGLEIIQKALNDRDTRVKRAAEQANAKFPQ